MVEYDTDKVNRDSEEKTATDRAKEKWRKMRETASKKVREMGFSEGDLDNNEERDDGE